jgi:histidinol-phosphate phosphatase family protein
VVPTVGRDTLRELLADLAGQPHRPDRVVVVDDRRDPAAALDVTQFPGAIVLVGDGRGPAAARNAGWRSTGTEWVVFLDDDVRLPGDWSAGLLQDLDAAERDDGPGARVGGVQGRIVVPLPAGRAPTDCERSTAALEDARWATADMAYRRRALQLTCGFDERFPRAYREDADLALRVRQAGWMLRRGTRHVLHPVRREDFWVSVRAQRGNSDDALMRALHGPFWRSLAGCPRGRFGWHVVTVLAGVVAVAAGLRAAGGRAPVRRGARRTASAAALTWTALTADLTRRRIAPGPLTTGEIARMAVTSVVIPPAAVWYRLRGGLRHRRVAPWPGPVRAVLFDRDGTLIHDVPYLGDPHRVEPVDGAAAAVRRLRDAGIAVGVVTNQSGVGRGLISPEQMAAVNRRVDELVGPFRTWQVCPHGPDDACSCRKPEPEMVLAGAAALGVPVRQVAVVGDTGMDLRAAEAAGARAVLVPNGVTRPDEVAAAPVVVADLAAAVDYLLRCGADACGEGGR